MMRTSALFLFLLGMGLLPAKAQTLFEFGPHAVSKEEFLRVYQKNSLGGAPDMSREALEDYLDLYALFRMKVKVAEERRMDTITAIQAELDNYRRQLAKSLLTDDKVVSELVEEAYERMKEEVKVRHILLLAAPTAPPADTLRAYTTIDSLYKVLVAGKASFDDLAAKYSEDGPSAGRGGELGYITALQAIYSFENQAYQTPEGKLSRPFRSPFGYHILEVQDRRPSNGTVEVAQILVATRKSEGEEGRKRARNLADSLYKALNKGASFTELVAAFSEDKFSRENQGKMNPFRVGSMVPEFEEAAFALKKPGEISRPVETEYGFHIIQLLKKEPIAPFDSLKNDIRKQVESDGRFQIAREAFYQQVKERNGFREYPGNLDPVMEKVMAIPDTGVMANVLDAKEFQHLQEPLFELRGTPYSQFDFVTYAQEVTRGRIMGMRQGVVKDLYTMYKQSVIQDLEEQRIVRENPEIRQLMQEYRDGILLFELMDQEVWSKASRDTAGLQAFYKTRQGEYLWEPGFNGSLFRFKDESALKRGMPLLRKGKMTEEEIMEALNTEETPDAVSIQRGRFEFSRFDEFPRKAIKANSLTEARKNQDGSFTLLKVKEVYDSPSPKTLEEARGFVVAQYQDKLEKDWNAALKERFPVKVNEQVFQSMIRK